MTVLRTYTIYRGAADVDTAYCVREFLIGPGGGAGMVPRPARLWTPDTLDEARALVPAHADACLTRSPADDPIVVETWL